MRGVLILCAVAVCSAGAQNVKTVDPGMSKAQVIERLGAPLTVRSAGPSTYLFYGNGCEHECGMNDLVTLQNDSVVDAIFRSPAHKYTGVSSSPTAIPKEQAAHGSDARPVSRPAARARKTVPPPVSDPVVMRVPTTKAPPKAAAAKATGKPARDSIKRKP